MDLGIQFWHILPVGDVIVLGVVLTLLKLTIKVIRGIQYVLSMMHKCIMVKVGGRPKNTEKEKIGGIYKFG